MSDILYWLSHGGAHKVRDAIPHVAHAAQVAMNPISILNSLSASSKKELRDAFKAARGGGRATTAINMAYGKRRNNRIKRKSRSRAPPRKRRSKRTPSKGSSNMLAAILAGMKGTMQY